MGIFRKGEQYFIDYYVRDASGAVRRKRERAGTNYKLAKEALAKRQGEIAQRTFFPERHRKRVRFEDAAKDLLKWAEVNISARGHERYRCSVDNLISAFGRLHLDELTPTAVEAFKADRLKEVKPATINRDLMVLKRLYNLILKGQLLPDVAVPESLPRRISLMRENNHRVRYLSPREYAELLLACDRLHARRGPATRAQAIDMKTLVVVAVHTGMREGEILNLKWADVDFQSSRISVHQGKGGYARTVPMNRVAAEALDRLPRRIDSPYVFCHAEHGKRTGKPFHWIKIGWESLLKEAGITNLRFHDLRHTAASWLVMAGVNLQRVQQILGHKSYQTTLRYAHLAPDQGKDAVEKLCDVVATGHYTDTSTPREGGHMLKAAANDGTTRTNGAGDRTRTGNLRLMKPPL
jgi:integrase